MMTTLESRYADNYERMACDDLAQAIVPAYYTLAQAHKLVGYCGDLKGKRVLDIGAGRGVFLSLIPYARRVAVDISPAYVAYLRSQNIIAIQANAEDLPFENEFDVVVMVDILEHVLNPDRAIASAWRALRPGGRLLVRVPYLEDISVYKPENGCKYEFAHLRSFDAVSLRSLLSPPFKVTATHLDGFVPYQVRTVSSAQFLKLQAWQKSKAQPPGMFDVWWHMIPALPYIILHVAFAGAIARLPNWLGRRICHPLEICVVGVKVCGGNR